MPPPSLGLRPRNNADHAGPAPHGGLDGCVSTQLDATSVTEDYATNVTFSLQACRRQIVALNPPIVTVRLRLTRLRPRGRRLRSGDSDCGPGSAPEAPGAVGAGWLEPRWKSGCPSWHRSTALDRPRHGYQPWFSIRTGSERQWRYLGSSARACGARAGRTRSMAAPGRARRPGRRLAAPGVVQHRLPGRGPVSVGRSPGDRPLAARHADPRLSRL